MLKKLVRYGNSNALILDKAILELLNIEEGSIIKISTDGRSIILTPQQAATALPINETVTSHETLHEANIKESMKFYKNLDSETKKTLEQEMFTLLENHQAAIMSLESNEAYKAEREHARIAYGSNHTEFMDAHKILMGKYAPTLAQYPQKIAAFDKKCRQLAGMEIPNDMEEQQKQMSNEMESVFRKHQSIQASFMSVMNLPEYQHAAQTLTEKFQGDQSSTEFAAAMKTLMYEFCPAMETVHQELEAISKKYVPKK